MADINKTLTAVGAAVVIGTGAIVTYNLTTQDTGIDWSKYNLNIPSLDIPSLNIPSLNITELDNTKIDLPDLKKQVSLNVDTNVNANIDTNIDTNIEKGIFIENLILNDEELNKLGITINDIQIQELPDPSCDMDKWIKFAKDVNKYFIDKRMVFHDSSLHYNNNLIKKWLEIYNKYKDANDIKYIPITKSFRMITQVRVPKNSSQMNILNENLKYYKSEGYDSVLVGFDNNSNKEDLLNVVKYIIATHKMNVWFTYTGEETLSKSVFMDPDKYTEIIKTIAPYASGFVNSWRRTSVHLWQQDDAWKKYTNTILREANPIIPIIGELYYGNTHKYDTVRNVGFGINMFNNASACMIVNFGYNKIDMNYLFNVILKPYLKNIPKVGCVVGQKPYYLTDNDNGLSYRENMKIKHDIENKFFNHGCIGTVTLSNDGKKMETNDLSSTLYSTLGKK